MKKTLSVIALQCHLSQRARPRAKANRRGFHFFSCQIPCFVLYLSCIHACIYGAGRNLKMELALICAQQVIVLFLLIEAGEAASKSVRGRMRGPHHPAQHRHPAPVRTGADGADVTRDAKRNRCAFITQRFLFCLPSYQWLDVFRRRPEEGRGLRRG